MKKLHLAIASNDIAASIRDYSQRLGQEPCSFVMNEYALWRTDTLNLSIRYDPQVAPGSLRHLGWEDPSAEQFSSDTDVNGILWERFSAQQQADEINQLWPQVGYTAKKVYANLSASLFATAPRQIK